MTGQRPLSLQATPPQQQVLTACYSHVRGTCPAYGLFCCKCGRPNHFAACCHQTNVEYQSTSNPIPLVRTIQGANYVELKINHCRCKALVNTAANISCLDYVFALWFDCCRNDIDIGECSYKMDLHGYCFAEQKLSVHAAAALCVTIVSRLVSQVCEACQADV